MIFEKYPNLLKQPLFAGHFQIEQNVVGFEQLVESRNDASHSRSHPVSQMFQRLTVPLIALALLVLDDLTIEQMGEIIDGFVHVFL